MPSMQQTVYTCFLASPNDVAEERDVCEDVVSEINRVFASKGIVLRLLRWEKDGIPAVGEDAQAVINKQLSPNEADFFIGILWAKFGEPTARAESGTEEEFNDAYNQWRRSKANHIMMFFKTAPVPHATDGAQLEKVKRFRNRIAQEGVFYKEFPSSDEFAKILRESFEKILLEKIPVISPDDKIETIRKTLSENLRKALSVFQEDIQWIDRFICEYEQLPCSLADLDNKAISIDSIIDSAESFIVSAPPQYGLTSSAHHLRCLAWEKGQAWGYLDMDRLPKLSDLFTADLQLFRRDQLDCIIVDSWEPQKNFSAKVFEAIESNFPNARIVVFHTRSESGFARGPQIRIERDLKSRELLPLPRHSVRKAVATHCLKISDDEDSALEKLLGDLESMNIPRTPINCWTVLKASESRVEQSPVNRTELFDLLLYVLFNRVNPPNYGTFPDTKDCNRFLGSFCEQLIRETQTVFSKQEFIRHCSEFCDHQLVDVDVEVVFTILVENRIIIRLSSTDYRFGASFWIYYFGAKRMEQSNAFKKYVLEDRHYVNFPEIIEFYTGYTRDREDVLSLLDEDLSKTKGIMNEKLHFPEGFNPLKGLHWISSQEEIQKLQSRLSNDLSGLPAAMRDQCADREYDYIRPYNQSLQKCMEDSSFFAFVQQIKAISTALRNSDYASPEIRQKIIRHILSGWLDIMNVLFALSPILAKQGRAVWEGFGFRLDDSFNKFQGNPGKIFFAILQACPHNVVHLVKNDLSSRRIGKLLHAVINSGLGEMDLHLLMLYLINERPPRWEVRIKKYIQLQRGNAFYLADIFSELRFILRYGFPDENDKATIMMLAKDCLSKHKGIPTNQISTKLLCSE